MILQGGRGFNDLIRLSTLALHFLVSTGAISQSYPVFGPERQVTISGLSFDAMEPFLDDGGNKLIFNSLNSGGNTNLYYATRVNDSLFSYAGLVGGVYDPSPNHLDGVASLDSLGNFFWVSTRGYPNDMDNLHRGKLSGSTVSAIKRVRGDFNIHTINFPFGWLIMDAAITYKGDQLYYCNALFDFNNTSCVGVPCEARLGIAQKTNDTTFTKLVNSDGLLQNVNDTSYVIYAPQLSRDRLELYFTRLLKNTFNTEICVSVRSSTTADFGIPLVLYSSPGRVPEGPTLTLDKQKLYYHQKEGAGQYRIYMRDRVSTTGLDERDRNSLLVFPNPTSGRLSLSGSGPIDVTVYGFTGDLILSSCDRSVDLTGLPRGVYFLKINQDGNPLFKKVVKY